MSVKTDNDAGIITDQREEFAFFIARLLAWNPWL